MSREKIRINVGTIGHVDHGKTTTTAAITKILSVKFANLGNQYLDYASIDKAPEEKKRGITINQATVPYSMIITQDGVEKEINFSHTDCPGHADYIKNMITGSASMDCAILVVDAKSSVCPQTKEHVILASQIGIKNIVVYLNKCDTVEDAEFIDLVKEEVKMLLDIYKYNVPDEFYFCGSSLKALEGDAGYTQVIVDMMETIATKIPHPIRLIDKPFKLSIEKPLSIPGRGTVATGTVEQGTLNLNEEVELIGGGRDPKKVVVTGLEAFHKAYSSVEAGWNVGVLLRGVAKEDVERGMVLCKPGTVKIYKKIKAEVYLLKKEEGGRHSPITSGYRPQFFIKTMDVTGTISLEGVELLLPGEYGTINVEFHNPIPLCLGDQFVVREGGITVLSGKVTSVEG